MKLKNNILILIFVFFLIPSIYAIDLDSFDTSVTLYDDGLADVVYTIKFDSTEFDDLIYLPAYNPSSIIVTDNKGELKYITIGGLISVKPNKNVKDYSMKVRYFTDALTAKHNDNWSVYYELLPYSSMNFEGVNEASLSFILPKTSTLIASTKNQVVFLDDNLIVVKWDIGSSDIDSFKANLVYKTNPSHSKIKDYLIVLVIAILVSLLLIIISLKGWDCYVRRISKGKRDIIKTLTVKEKEIIELLIQNKGKLTQSNVQKMTGISKATVSRMVKLSQRRGIVEIRPAGNTNYILITEWFNKK